MISILLQHSVRRYTLSTQFSVKIISLFEVSKRRKPRACFFLKKNSVETLPTFCARKCSFVLRLQFHATEIMTLQRSLHTYLAPCLETCTIFGFESTLSTTDYPGNSGFKSWSRGIDSRHSWPFSVCPDKYSNSTFK